VSVLYVAFQRVLQVVFLLFRSTEFKELEIVVLRHELAVLRRHVRRPAFRSADRWFLAVAARVLPKVRWSPFLLRRQRCCDGIGVSWRDTGPTVDDPDARRSTLTSEPRSFDSRAKTHVGAIGASSAN